MKVLKKGRNQKGWTVEQTCAEKGGGCGALLLVSEEDIYKTYKAGYSADGEEVFLNFICPCCGTETQMDDVDIPRLVEEKILSKKDFFKRLRSSE